MPTIKLITQFGIIKTGNAITGARYVAMDSDGSVYVSTKSLAAAPKIGAVTETLNASDYKLLTSNETGKALGFALYDNTTATKGQIYLYGIEGKAWGHDLKYGSTPIEITQKNYLSYTTVVGASSTNFTFYQPLDATGNIPTTTVTIKTDTGSGLLAGVTTLPTAGGVTTPIPIASTTQFVLTDKLESDTDTYTKLAIAGDKLFLLNGTSSDANLTASNALYLYVDPATVTTVKTLLTSTLKNSAGLSTAGLFLTKDQQQNYHLTITNNDAADAISVRPIDLTFSSAGQLLSNSPLNYSALNYLLDGALDSSYTLAGNYISQSTPLLFETGPDGLHVTSSDEEALLQLYKVSYQTTTISGEESLQSLGWVLSTVSDTNSVSINNSYYLGDSLGIDDIITKGPSIFVNNGTMLVIWNNNTSSDPLYLKSVKGSPVTSIDRLTTDKLLGFENSLGLDINGDGNIGKISYVQISPLKQPGVTATTLVTLYQGVASQPAPSSSATFSIKATVPGTYNILDGNVIVGSVKITTPNASATWTLTNYKPADGIHTLTVAAAAGTTGTATIALPSGTFDKVLTLKVISTSQLPAAYSANDTAYYVVHDAESAIVSADFSGSVLRDLYTNRRLIGVISKDGTPPSDTSTVPTLGGESIPVLAYDQNGNFFTLKAGTTLSDPSYISQADLQQKMVAVTASALRAYELTNKLDLNGDGVIGAVAESTILENENFTVYKTTNGDLVYSAIPGLLYGDAIQDAVGIALTPQDQKLLESAKSKVASIQTGKLYLASQSQDALTGLTVLHETVFSLSTTIGPATFSSPTTTDWVFNNNSEARKAFLAKENFYNVDLNNDGVIGDAIVNQLTSNSEGTVYQTAAGTIYISTNSGLNIGDIIDPKVDIKLYDLERIPDHIDAAIYSNNTVVVFKTQIQGNTTVHSRESFTVSASTGTMIATSIGSSPLSKEDLVIAEINYAVDINGDGRVGALISEVLFGANSSSYPEITSQDAGLFRLKLDRDSEQPLQILAAAVGANAQADDTLPANSVYFLKNTQNSASMYWQLPTYAANHTTTIVGAGIFSINSNNAVDLVISDTPNAGYAGTTNYYLISFDATGSTAKPRGTLLTPFGLYNEELKIGTDLTGDGIVGDTITKIATADNFGVYELNHSGAIVLTTDGTWVDGDESTPDIQQSTNFISLKNANGSNWLPYGWSETAAAGGIYQINKTSDHAEITQVAFNADGTFDAFVLRQLQTSKGLVNTVYDVTFNKNGITKNPTGTALSTTALYSKELKSGLDINGDDFIGKPFIGLNTLQSNTNRGQSQFSSGNITDPNSNSVYFSGVPVYVPAAYQTTTIPTYASSSPFLYATQMIYSKFSKTPFMVTWTGGAELSVYKANVATPSKIILPTAATLRISAPNDFDGNGNSDFAIATATSVQLYKGDGKGSFTPLQSLSLTYNNEINSTPMLVASGLFNKDSAVDLALLAQGGLDNNNDVLTIFTNKNKKLYDNASADLGITGTNELLAADVNGDKKSDLVLTHKSANQIDVVFNVDGNFIQDQKFINKVSLSGIYSPSNVHVADINGDGLNDIVAQTKTAAGFDQIQAFLGIGSGDFLDAQTLISVSDLLNGDFATNNFIDSFTLSDLNNDGLKDFVVNVAAPGDANRGMYQAQVYWNLSNLGNTKTTGNFVLSGNDYGVIYYGANGSELEALNGFSSHRASTLVNVLGLQKQAEQFDLGFKKLSNNYSNFTSAFSWAGLGKYNTDLEPSGNFLSTDTFSYLLGQSLVNITTGNVTKIIDDGKDFFVSEKTIKTTKDLAYGDIHIHVLEGNNSSNYLLNFTKGDAVHAPLNSSVSVQCVEGDWGRFDVNINITSNDKTTELILVGFTSACSGINSVETFNEYFGAGSIYF